MSEYQLQLGFFFVKQSPTKVGTLNACSRDPFATLMLFQKLNYEPIEIIGLLDEEQMTATFDNA